MKVIIAGGGTGGHVFPGIAVAREVMRRNSASQVLFVGAAAGVEARLVPREGFALKTLSVGGFQGMGSFRKLANAMAMVKGVIAALSILGSFKPDVVIGVGGYASFPVMAAAILRGCPRLLMEQNAMPGLANRFLGRWVTSAAVTEPSSLRYFGSRGVVTGNPVRPEFKKMPPAKYTEPFSILVFGGSQGAQTINRAVVAALPLLGEWKGRVRFTHQTGAAQVHEVRNAYSANGFEAEVEPFFDAFHERYAAADLLIARAGATTIAEIKASGRASILVPYPFAADDHQTKNAMAMADAGAALWVANSELTGDWLAGRIRGLLADPAQLGALANRAKALALPDAEVRVVDLAERAAGMRAGVSGN